MPVASFNNFCFGYTVYFKLSGFLSGSDMYVGLYDSKIIFRDNIVTVRL